MELMLYTGNRDNCQRLPLTPHSLEQRLGQAIRDGEGVGVVRSLVEEGADISCLCDSFWTPLTWAAHLGQVEVVSYLLCCIQQASHQSVNPYRWRTTVDSVNDNDNGQSALICAASQGHKDVCCTLLEAGADVNLQCHHSKQTALLVAVEAKEREVIEVLLDWGADVQLTDNVGITPLYAAVKGNACDIVQLLIEAGCDVNIGSQDHAPIFLAARKGFLSIVQVLCEAGCYIDIANKYGVTALSEAALNGENSVLQYLIERGCDINRCDMYSVSPLQVAVMMSNPTGVKLLMQAGACVKLRNRQGQCAVQMAMEMGKVEILEYFLQCGVDVTRRPNLTFIQPRGMSPLRIVFERLVFPRTMLLLLRGCSKLDLRTLNSVCFFRTHPILLELALASGLSQPPSKLLRSSDPGDFSPECLQWLRQFRSVPLTLKQASRCCIRRSLGNTILHSAPLLPLPSLMVDFVIFASAEIDDL